MATSDYSGYRQIRKMTVKGLKLKSASFDMLWRFGVMEEKP